MPSLEIICLGQRQPTDFSHLPFAVVAEPELVSHRGESSLFQRYFDRVDGCIYHLGNPCLKESFANRIYFASELLEEWEERLEFKSEYVPFVQQMLETLLVASPDGRILFTSDYQFGPGPRRFLKWRTLDQFWILHSKKALYMNALYSLQNDAAL